MAGGGIGVEDGLLLAGEGVELAADALHAVGDVHGAAVLGALEKGVLYEVRQPILALGLVARAGVHCHAAVGNLPLYPPVHALQAVGQRKDMILVVLLHCLICFSDRDTPGAGKVLQS